MHRALPSHGWRTIIFILVLTGTFAVEGTAEPVRVDVTLPKGMVNLSPSGHVSASSSASQATGPEKAIDGDLGPGSWTSAGGSARQWIEIDFDSPRRVEALSIYPLFKLGQPRWKSYRVEIKKDGSWEELPLAGAWIMPGSMHFSVKARIQGARLVVEDAGGKAPVSIAEFELYGPPPESVGKASPVSSNSTLISLAGLDISRGQSIDLLPLKWHFQAGDDVIWSQPGYDDSKWRNIEVGRSWLEQSNIARVASDETWESLGTIVWYRVRFTVPKSWKGSPVALDLGTISNYDTAYVNGALMGYAGLAHPDNPFLGTSVFRAIHYVPAASLRYGEENVLAVRCRTSDYGCLYKGPYRAVRLTSREIPPVRIDTDWKVSGADAPSHYLSTHEHLNTYRAGEPVIVQPNLSLLLNEPHALSLSYALLGKEDQQLATGVFEPKKWDGLIRHFRSVRMPTLSAGEYRLRITCKAENQNIQETVLPFRVEAPLNSASFKQDPALTAVHFSEPARSLDRESIGHYGGSQFRKNGDAYVLDYDPAEGNANGNLVNSSLVASYLPGPMLLSHNYKNPPRSLMVAADYDTEVPGYARIEGEDGVWNFGFFGLEHGLMPSSVEVERASWTGARYLLRYSIDGSAANMRFYENSLSPAVLLEINHQRAALFSGMSLFGLGAPSHVAFVSSRLAQTTDLRPGTRVDLRDRSENWLLFSFHGATGFDEFDTPYLVVTEKKAQSLVVSDAGITLEYAAGSQAGRIWVMPLYGQRMLTLEETSAWDKALPSSVLRDVRFWSSTLLDYPISCKESYRVFGERHSVAIEDSFEYLKTEDAWHTKPTLIAPVSPVLSLAAQYKFPVSFGQPVEVANLVALQGPVAFTHGDRVRFAIDDVIRLGDEVRAVEGIQETNPTEVHFRQLLNAETDRIFKQFHLDQHPWTSDVHCEGTKNQPGTVSPFMIDLALAIPYLDKPLAERVTQAIRTEIDASLMQPSNYVHMSNRDTSLVTSIYPASLINRLGSDNMAWTGTHLYALWVYAHTTGDWSLVEKYWPDIKLLFNIMPNTADWAAYTPWDILNGARLGNGIQEVGHALAGMTAYLRMASKMGDETDRDYAAYLLARQGVSLYAQFVGNRWARTQVPWLTSAPWGEAVLDAEVTASWRETEPDEFHGYSVNAIQARRFIPPSSFMLTPVPEIMRFYHDYAREESTYYWTQILPRIPWEEWDLEDYHGLMVNVADEMLYTTDISQDEAAKVAEREALRPQEWFLGTIPNFRGVIESGGKREYRPVVWPLAMPSGTKRHN